MAAAPATLRVRQTHGVASERPDSASYVSTGGYGMRGPVWPPYVALLGDGLVRAGETALARAITDGFCRAVRAAGSDYEDFDALTGAGRDDPAYTWTSAVHIDLLAARAAH